MKTGDESLPYLMFAYRDMPIADVGFSPYELLYGRPIKGPLGLSLKIGGKMRKLKCLKMS